MNFAAKRLNAYSFNAKILDHNQPSLSLFSKLGFEKTHHAEVFKTTTLTLHILGGDRPTAPPEEDAGGRVFVDTYLNNCKYEETKDDYKLPPIDEK